MKQEEKLKVSDIIEPLKALNDFFRAVDIKVQSGDFHVRREDITGKWLACVNYHILFSMPGSMTKKQAEEFMYKFIRSKADKMKSIADDILGENSTRHL